MEEDGRRLDNFLLTRTDVPRQVVYQWIRTGQVRVNRGRAKPSSRLRAGDEVRIPPHHPGGLVTKDAAVPDIPIAVLHEDEDLLIVNKPAGLAVHGGSRVRFGLINVLRQQRSEEKFLELAHRLDRGSSGCLVLARNRAALQHMQAQFRNRAVQKLYQVLVAGQWQGGDREMRQSLRINRQHARHRKAIADDQGRQACTWLHPLQQFGKCCLVQARIETGRTHQIRVHASIAGHPVIGDKRYGDYAMNAWAARHGFKRMFLHAHSLDFEHPSEEEIVQVTAPLDAASESFLALLAETAEA